MEVVLGGAYRILGWEGLLNGLSKQQQEYCARIGTIVQLLRVHQSPWLHESLADILYETSAFESSDPRDRIFAIAGCLNSFPDHLVDYRKALPEVLTDVATCESDREEFMLSLFRGMCYVDTLSNDVPSWVPTWQFSTPRWQTLCYEIEEDGIDVSQMELSVSENRKVLKSGAIIFDKITALSDPGIIAQDHAETCDWLAQCEKMARNTTDNLKRGDEHIQLFVKCFTFSDKDKEDVDLVTAYQSYLRRSAILSAIEMSRGDPVLCATQYKKRCQDLNVSPEQPGLIYAEEKIDLTYERQLALLSRSFVED
jgi:hypothetical protein